MHNVREICEDSWWLGASDRRLEFFENTYPAPAGMSYDNYLILDEKTCLMDGTDEVTILQVMENLEYLLAGRTLDYMVVDHMEPDHCRMIPQLVERYPEIKLVATAKSFELMSQFFDFDVTPHAITVKENDTLELGRHTLQFFLAPMVHWPEVMVSYDQLTGVLYSADAFGEFGALGGNIFADEVDWEHYWLDEARRYYVNIVGKYGVQTNMLLKKLAKLDIRMICPLHGHIWRKDFNLILDKYAKWASYEPEIDSVAIFYGSVYGDTAVAADILAGKLAERGMRNVRVYDSSKTMTSELVSVAFQYSKLVFACATYNLGIFDSMRTLLDDIAAHALKNRVVGIMENGSWAPTAGKLIQTQVEAMPNMTIIEPVVHLRSSVKEANLVEIEALADALASA